MSAVRPDAQQPSRSSRRSVFDPVTLTSAVQWQEPRDALAAVSSCPGVWAPGLAPRGCQLRATLRVACGGVLPRPWGVAPCALKNGEPTHPSRSCQSYGPTECPAPSPQAAHRVPETLPAGTWQCGLRRAGTLQTSLCCV